MDESPAPGSVGVRRDNWLAETWRVQKDLGQGLLRFGLWVVIPIFIFFRALGPIAPGNAWAPQSACLQQAHALGLALFSYCKDQPDGHLDGNSSTEIFQKLLDGGYVTDARIFYVAMEGKAEPAAGEKKLKPENICWDVTGGMDPSDSAQLPVLFLTGYRITYAPGGGAVPLHLPRPFSWHTFSASEPMNGLAVYFKGNRAMWITSQGETTTDDGRRFTMPHLVPADFDAHGKTYRQLTPEGVLR